MELRGGLKLRRTVMGSADRTAGMLGILTNHWPEYLMEGAELGILMVLACSFATLLEYPASPLHEALTNIVARRAVMGAAMAATVVALIYSPWGRQSGAHFNPAVTLTFFRLGKVAPWDAGFYIGAHFAGGVTGVLVAAAALGRWLASPSVNYAVTTPGPGGPTAAFAGEFAASFIFMTAILVAINAPRLERFTGLFVGVMVAVFILVESPLSGMSINPARTLASAVPARVWTGLWVYFVAPSVGMLLAAEAYLRVSGRSVRTAKLCHDDRRRCFFRCDHHAGAPTSVAGGRYASGHCIDLVSTGTGARGRHVCFALAVERRRTDPEGMSFWPDQSRGKLGGFQGGRRWDPGV